MFLSIIKTVTQIFYYVPVLSELNQILENFVSIIETEIESIGLTLRTVRWTTRQKNVFFKQKYS